MEPSRKNPEIRRIQSTIMGADVTESIRTDVCVRCQKPAVNFTDKVSRREFAISGLCQECQDKVFGALAEDE